MEQKELVLIRDYLPSDKNFIYASFLKGLRYGNEMFELIDAKVYFDIYQRVIENILDQDSTLVKVACLKDEPEVILGYSIATPTEGLIHFLFVKSAWRGIGIGTTLMSEGIHTATHTTKIGTALIKKKHLKYNPFMV